MSKVANERTLDQVFIRGKITYINQPLLYFKVDGKFKIYVDVTNHLPEFPCKDNEVEIINPRKFNEKTGTVFIGPKTKCNFPSVLTIKDTQALELYHVLKENNADEDELVALDSILRQLEPFFPEHVLAQCLISLVCNSPLVMNGLQQHGLKYKRSLKQSQIKFPSDLNYVNDTSDLYQFMKFDGMCMYNVYPNRCLHNVTDSCTEYLFGILDVDLMSGSFSLSHRTFKILVKFYTTVKSLYIFKNSLVMFKKWTVFTEVFQGKSSTLKYIVANVEDVIVIESMININHERLFYPKNELWNAGQRKMIFLQIIRMSEVIYGYNKEPECWIEGLISERDHSSGSKKLVYVILANNHIAILPFLKEHIVYQIFYDKEPKILKIGTYQEFNRLKNSKNLYRIGKDTIFQETDISPVPQNDPLLENFQDVEKFIKSANQNRIFSFCLRISRKNLQDNSNYASWIPRRHDNAVYFGTPGKNRQARLVFQNSISHTYIDLYLSDRDNHVTPLGLIENMKVKIKHVQVYKNKYIKTNVFSSFEILEYCPEIMFSSVNFDRSTWHWKNSTPKTLLGMFPYLPEKCIVHGTFLLQAFSFIKITPICDRCKNPSVAEMPCHSCGINDRDLYINMSICVQDSINPTFYMNTENKYLFLELIGIRSSNEIKQFCNAFFKIGVVKVNFCNLDEFPISIKDVPSKIFVDDLLKMIRTEINFNLFPIVDAVCMKQMMRTEEQWKIIEFVCI